MAEYFPASGGVASPTTVGMQLDTRLKGQRIVFATRKSYESSVRFWKAAPIDGAGVTMMGTLPLRALRHSHILTALASKPLAKGKTINNLMSVLRLACGLAVSDKLLAEDPTSEVKAAKHQKLQPVPFSAEEAERIIAALAERNDPQERNYFEFNIAKSNGIVKVGGIAMELRKADLKKNKFNMSVVADDGQSPGRLVSAGRHLPPDSTLAPPRKSPVSGDTLKRGLTRPAEITMVFTEVCLIEQALGEPWRVIDRYALGS